MPIILKIIGRVNILRFIMAQLSLDKISWLDILMIYQFMIFSLSNK